MNCFTCGEEIDAGAAKCRHCGTSLLDRTLDESSPTPRRDAGTSDLPRALDGGRYEVLELLGEGQSKRVYRARDTRLGRDVAVALFKDSPLSAQARERLRREVLAMGRLGGHPGSVVVHDVGEEGDQSFFVAEYLDGGDLAAALRSASKHQLTISRAIAIGQQLLSTLAFAHEHGVIHRDVKPSNIWLTADGTAKLGDFGVAHLNDVTQVTQAGGLIGTVTYMAPEQTLGQPADANTDLYSVGCVLYELVAGRPPFLGEDAAAVIGQHLNSAPVSPSWHNPRCPVALETVILRLLEKDSRHRPGSAAEALELLAAIDPDAGDTATRRPTAQIGPYMGLRPFEAEDANLYFGRNAAVESVLERLARDRVVGIVGTSGSGKSSLVRAGVVPGVRAGALAGSAAWPVIVMNPGARPLSELATQLANLTGGNATQLLGDLESDPRALDLTARQLVGDAAPGTRLLLVVDQFEELFTLCRDAADREGFAAAILEATAAPNAATAFLFTIRADFFGECASLPGFAAAVDHHDLLLGPLSEEELRAAIEQPAEMVGLRVEADLSERILRDVSGEPGGLPLLSHALLETWKRREGRVLTVHAYEEAGGVRGAIARTADAVFEDLDEAEQSLARNLFLRLTEPGEGTEDTRRRVAPEELATAGVSPERLEALLAQLIEARLLTASEGGVEVAHEALIREWPRLRGWLDEDRDGLRVLRHLTDSAQAWARLDRDPGELYRGTRLAAATEWVARSSPDLNQLEHEFLDAGQALHAQQQRDAAARLRRLRMLLAGVAGLLAVAVVVGVFAFIERGRADDEAGRAEAALAVSETERGRADAAAALAAERADAAEAAEAAEATARGAAVDAAQAAEQRRLESEALRAVKTRTDLSFLLSVEAWRHDESASSRGTLLAALSEEPRFLGFLQTLEASVESRAITVSPDGRSVAVESSDELIRIYDTNSGDLLDVLPAGPTVGGAILLYSPDGALLLSGGGNVPDNLTAIDTDTGQVAYVASHAGNMVPMAFTPDGSLLLANGRLIDVASGEVVRYLIPEEILARGIGGTGDISPDGSLIVQASIDVRGDIIFLDGTTYEPIGAPLTVFPGDFIFDALFSPDGSVLAVLGRLGRLRLWDPVTREPLSGALEAGTNASQMAFTPDGNFLVIPGGISSLFVWDVRAGKPIADPIALKFPGNPSSIAIGPEGRIYINISGTVGVWDLNGSGLINQLFGDVSDPASLSGDGTRLAALGSGPSPNAPLTVWDAATNELLFGPIDTGAIPSQGLPPIQSSDGLRLVTTHTSCTPNGGRDCADQIQVWNMERSGVLIGSIEQPAQFNEGTRYFVASPALSADGSLVAVVGQDGFINVHDTSTLAIVAGPLHDVAGGDATLIDSLALGERDGVPLLAALRIQGGEDRITLWALRPSGPELLATAPGPSSGVVVFTADGLVAVGDAAGKGEVALYDPTGLTLVQTLPSTEPVRSLAVSDDGRLMAGGAGFGAPFRNASVVQLWDAQSGASIGDPFGFGIYSSLSGDGTAFLTSGGGAAVLWNLDVAVWESQACRAAGRNLTVAEWEQFLPPGEPYRATCEQWPSALEN